MLFRSVTETKPGKKDEHAVEPTTNTPVKYIVNDDFKNKEGTNEMAVLIINKDNSINADMSQKVASVFLKNNQYNNTASLLSTKFVTDGLFNKIFNGIGIDISKQKFSDYADYFCLGRLSTETNPSDYSNDMIKADLILEIKVVKTINGAAIINFTVPSQFSQGAAFKKKEAIEVATGNIITYLKNYRHEN